MRVVQAVSVMPFEGFGKKGEKWKVERVKRSAGYRSKQPSADGVSAWAFTHADLREAASIDHETETRGNCGQGASSYRPGDVARSLLGVRLK